MLTVYVRSWRYTRWQNSLGYPIFFNVDVFVTSCVIPSPVHTKHPRTMIPMECGNSRSKKPWFRWTGVFSNRGKGVFWALFPDTSTLGLKRSKKFLAWHKNAFWDSGSFSKQFGPWTSELCFWNPKNRRVHQLIQTTSNNYHPTKTQWKSTDLSSFYHHLRLMPWGPQPLGRIQRVCVAEAAHTGCAAEGLQRCCWSKHLWMVNGPSMGTDMMVIRMDIRMVCFGRILGWLLLVCTYVYIYIYIYGNTKTAGI